jgi:addiction module HigA family antidote
VSGELDPTTRRLKVQLIHPGEHVTEYMQSRGWTYADLAWETHLPLEVVRGLCHGEAPVTPVLAAILGIVFERPTHFWLNLQKNYDADLAHAQALFPGIERLR